MKRLLPLLTASRALSLTGWGCETFQTNGVPIKATPARVSEPASWRKLQPAQGELTGAVSRWTAVSENHWTLWFDRGSRDLSARLPQPLG